MAVVQNAPTDSNDGDDLVEAAIHQVEAWIRASRELEGRADRAAMQQLSELVRDESGLGFVMNYIDQVARPHSPSVAADQLQKLVGRDDEPTFLSLIDRLMLRVGARVAPLAPSVVMKLAGLRMRSIVGPLVAPAERAKLQAHLDGQVESGYQSNVNLLGEAVLGEREARRRLESLKALLNLPEIDYVSVKITAVASQINHWSHVGSLKRLTGRLAEMVDTAEAASTPTFVNFDMEEFHDLYLTIDAFKAVLGEPERQRLDAGIVVQAYLPESLAVLQDLVAWSNERYRSGGGTIKIRLVKGANLAMERVESALHGWEQAPYGSKVEADASYRSCLDWALYPGRLDGVRIGVASHNLFDVAWAKLLADKRGVSDRTQFEMLQGMAPGQAKAVNADTSAAGGAPTLLYTPAVADDDFDVAIGYLFRRLEENASPENFLHHIFDLEPGSDTFVEQADFFRSGVELRHTVSREPRRFQDRSLPPEAIDPDAPFTNDAETDPSQPANQAWIQETLERQPTPCQAEWVTDVAAVESIVAVASAAQRSWWERTASERRDVLHRVAEGLAARRSELLATMMHEAHKTIAQGDVEVSEAIDFARYYGDRALDLEAIDGANFTPFGVVAVVPPWNFPVAIPAGGVLASLAAGNSVLFKPAPQTQGCAELVAEACWEAGVPRDVLHFVRAGDDDAGRAVVEAADALILTGSSETADLFRSWKPDMQLFAETSGKNALIVTPSADLDLAVDDLVKSAFGHGGQKCSAASIAILVGEVATSERFRRQLVDAVESLSTGAATDPGTDIAPLVEGGNERLDRAVDTLDGDERWLVKPSRTANGSISPGVREGVHPGSWFHTTECFGPVLGLIAVETLDEAIDIANGSDFGLTGGIHTLDPAEIHEWMGRIEIGNGYVNRAITGAIVQRQPFGGWKRSSVGPGAKAGGPNYLAQLGRWAAADPVDESDDFEAQWRTEFAQAHDPSGLFCEANLFRYRPVAAMGLVLGDDATGLDRRRVESAASLAGVPLRTFTGEGQEERERWTRSLAADKVERVRFVGMTPTVDDYAVANQLGIHLVTGPVLGAGRIELLHYVREQAMSVTLHRFGNLVNVQAFLHDDAPSRHPTASDHQ